MIEIKKKEINEVKIKNTLKLKNYKKKYAEAKIVSEQEIKKLVKVAKFFPACDFCNGRPYDGTSSVGYDGKGMIEAGIQTSKPLPYKQYK